MLDARALRTQFRVMREQGVGVHNGFDRATTELVQLRMLMQETSALMEQHAAYRLYDGASLAELVAQNARCLALARRHAQAEAATNALADELGALGRTNLAAMQRATLAAWMNLCLVWAPLAGRLAEMLAAERKDVA